MTTTDDRSAFPFEPDYAVHPGETLAEVLETKEMSQAELARRSGLSPKHINLVLHGRAGVTPDTALKLERVLDVPARIWTALDANHQHHRTRLNEAEALSTQVGWASGPLVKHLGQRGWITATNDAVANLQEVLRFFGVASLDAWESVWSRTAPLQSYRLAKHESDKVALAAWIRIGELESEQVATGPFSHDGLVDRLDAIRALTRIPSPSQWLPQLQELCREVGVVARIEPELPKARVNGVARWLTPTKALIQLSGRWLRDDVLWFTLFHEIGHLLHHAKRSGPRDLPDTFIDIDRNGKGPQEEEADKFAADVLIPPSQAHVLKKIKNLDAVQAVASDLGISPGIVVGRMIHKGYRKAPWGLSLVERYKKEDFARNR